MNNPFIKYVMKEAKEDIFHSSAYGKAQNADAMGATSTESFGERMKMEKNRKIVRAYSDARVINGAYVGGPKAEKYVPPEKKQQVNGAGVMKPAQKSVMVSEAKKVCTPSVKPKFGV